jgi:hypothetical protein
VVVEELEVVEAAVGVLMLVLMLLVVGEVVEDLDEVLVEEDEVIIVAIENSIVFHLLLCNLTGKLLKNSTCRSCSN